MSRVKRCGGCRLLLAECECAMDELPVSRIRLSKPQEALLRETSDGEVDYGGARHATADVLIDYGLIRGGNRTRRQGLGAYARITDRGQRWLRQR